MFRSTSTLTMLRVGGTLLLAFLVVATVLVEQLDRARDVEARNQRPYATLQKAVDAGVADPAFVETSDDTKRTAIVAIDGGDFDSVVREIRERVKVDEALPDLDLALVTIRSNADVLAISRLPGVEAVSANRTGPALLNKSLPIINQPAAINAGYSGRGTYVAVLDTGVDNARYPGYFAQGSVPIKIDASRKNGAALSYGHGTHVASTVLGVAPGTKIIAVDVFDWVRGQPQPQWDSAWIIEGIKQVVALKKQYLADNTKCCNVVAMNLSLGTGETYQKAFCSESLGFRGAYEVGIISVVSSGNDARATGSFREGISFPACSQYALSVGATTNGAFAATTSCEASSAADRITSFSQTGPTLQILAPGSCILAAGGAIEGTSMAAPHVAGGVALLASAKPKATAANVWNALTSTGKAITDNRTAQPITRNRLNVYSALTKLLGGTTTPTIDTQAPSVVAPSAAVTFGATIGLNGLIDTTFSWSATDASGIKAYVAKIRTNGGSWSTVTLNNARQTSVGFYLQPGKTYELAVAAQDNANNWSAYVLSKAITVQSINENSQFVTYSQGWESRAWNEALDGALALSATPDAYACISFNAYNVAWIGSLGTNRGKAELYLDGVDLGTIDLHADQKAAREVLFSRNVSRNVQHTLCIEVLGTAGRPTIDIDEFVFLY